MGEHGARTMTRRGAIAMVVAGWLLLGVGLWFIDWRLLFVGAGSALVYVGLRQDY